MKLIASLAWVALVLVHEVSSVYPDNFDINQPLWNAPYEIPTYFGDARTVDVRYLGVPGTRNGLPDPRRFNTPSAPSAPGVPSAPTFASPEVPSAPGVPAAPTFAAPGVPATPTFAAPGVPAAPAFAAPGVPSAPGVPTAPAFAAPGVPSAPAFAAPGAPAAPGVPTNSYQSWVYSMPNYPGMPTAPGAPAAPGVPSAPQAPSAPGVPSAPQAPSAPGVPSAPRAPAAPGVPSAPQAPSAPGVPSAPQAPSAPGMPSVPMIDVPQAQQDAVKNQLNETINEICQQLGQKTVPGGWGWCDSNSENLHEIFEFIPSFTLVLMSREELKAYIDLEEFMGDDYQLVWEILVQIFTAVETTDPIKLFQMQRKIDILRKAVQDHLLSKVKPQQLLDLLTNNPILNRDYSRHALELASSVRHNLFFGRIGNAWYANYVL